MSSLDDREAEVLAVYNKDRNYQVKVGERTVYLERDFTEAFEYLAKDDCISVEDIIHLIPNDKIRDYMEQGFSEVETPDGATHVVKDE